MDIIAAITRKERRETELHVVSPFQLKTWEEEAQDGVHGTHFYYMIGPNDNDDTEMHDVLNTCGKIWEDVNYAKEEDEANEKRLEEDKGKEKESA